MPLGFERQLRVISGTCSLHTVKHALLCLGIPVAMKDVTSAMGVGLRDKFRGNDEHRVMRGLKAFGYRAVEIDLAARTRFRGAVDKELRRGAPLALCVDDEKHWLVLAGRSGARYVWIDSAHRGILGESSWTEIAERARYVDGGERSYWALAVRPAKKHGLDRSMVPRIGNARDAIADDRRLRKGWGDYVQFLLDAGATGGPDDRALQELLEADADPLLDSLELGTGEAPRQAAIDELYRLAMVAYCHDLRVTEGAEFELGVAVAARLATR